MPEELPDNSHAAKAKKQKYTDKPKEQKIVSGEVSKRKKSLGKKFKEVFFGGELKGVGNLVVTEVILPAIRNLIVDSITRGIDQAVYGNFRGSRSGAGRTEPRGRTQYSAYSQTRDYNPRARSAYLPDQPPVSIARRSRTSNSNEVIFPTRQEAEQVLERLIDIIDMYDMTTVADLYEMTGLPLTPLDNKWGWTVLVSANITQIREGWLLELPQAEPL